LGFFYLDLRGDEAGEKLLNESSQLFGVGRELFDLGREELDRFDYKSLGSYFGYKGFGKGVVNAKGDLDWNEFYNVRFVTSWLLLRGWVAGERGKGEGGREKG
jgi:hypothetical protein